MTANKIDFSELEIKEIGSWPLVLRVAVLIGVSLVAVILVYFLVLEGQVSDLSSQEKQEMAKRDEFKEKYNMAVNLDAYQQQMQEVNLAYKDISKQLPTDSNIPDLIENISKLAEANHVKYDSIRLGEADSVSGFYKELPIELNLIGRYHNFAKFIQDVSKLPRVVTLHDFSITKGDADKDKTVSGILKMTLKIKTYWLSSDTDTKPTDKNTPAAPATPGMPMAPAPIKGGPPLPKGSQ